MVFARIVFDCRMVNDPTMMLIDESCTLTATHSRPVFWRYRLPQDCRAHYGVRFFPAWLVAMRRNSGGKTSTFFTAALRRFARKMKLNVSEKIAVGAASYVTVVFLIVAGSARVGGQDNPGETAFDAARAREASENPAGPGERMIDTDRGKGKASGKEAHDMTHSDATGGADVLNRISRETGVPVATLQTEKSATGLGYGDLEIANLLAKASGRSFDAVVAKFKAGEGWGKIAHDMGLNLGKIVSDAHRSSPKTDGKQLAQEKGANIGERSIIPGPGIRADSILFTGITPIPSTKVSRGVNPVPSAAMSPRP
jgi:hypothetical protein